MTVEDRQWHYQQGYKDGYEEGYADAKKKNYDCSCFADYPNESHRRKDGSWKCVDRFEKCEDWQGKYLGSCKTHCRKKEQKNE